MHISTKMTKETITETIEIPEGTNLDLSDNEMTIKKGPKSCSKRFDLKNIEVKKEGNSLVLSCKKSTKREKKMIKTIMAHLNNMIKGMDEEYVYKLEVVYLHFPITLELDKSNNLLLIKNYHLSGKENEGIKLAAGDWTYIRWKKKLKKGE